MANSGKTVREIAEQSAGRNTYVPPKLTTFGAVGALTQGGSTMMSEGAKGTATAFNMN
jgi:hypothetical protein